MLECWSAGVLECWSVCGRGGWLLLAPLNDADVVVLGRLGLAERPFDGVDGVDHHRNRDGIGGAAVVRDGARRRRGARGPRG